MLLVSFQSLFLLDSNCYSIFSCMVIKSVDVRKLGAAENVFNNKLTTLNCLGYWENTTMKMSSELQIKKLDNAEGST